MKRVKVTLDSGKELFFESDHWTDKMVENLNHESCPVEECKDCPFVLNGITIDHNNCIQAKGFNTMQVKKAEFVGPVSLDTIEQYIEDTTGVKIGSGEKPKVNQYVVRGMLEQENQALSLKLAYTEAALQKLEIAHKKLFDEKEALKNNVDNDGESEVQFLRGLVKKLMEK